MYQEKLKRIIIKKRNKDDNDDDDDGDDNDKELSQNRICISLLGNEYVYEVSKNLANQLTRNYAD